MEQIIVIFVIILLAYLYFDKYELPRRKYVEVEEENANNIADVKQFGDAYDISQNNIVETGLDTKDEYVQLFILMKDAYKKNKTTVAYKNIPHSPRMRVAFLRLTKNPKEFVTYIQSLSLAVSQQKVANSELGKTVNNQNQSNIMPVIVNDVTEQDKLKYTPHPPVSSWKYIERSTR